MQDVWGYVIDGLFVTFLVSIIGGIAASASSFNALLFGMFGSTAQNTISSLNSTTYPWVNNLTSSIEKGAETLYKVTDASAQVYPLGTYIAIFALFIGAVLGIVVYAMSLISGARAVPVRPM